jgi:hypothetical protein
MVQELLVKASPQDVGLLAHDLTRRTPRNNITDFLSHGPFHVANWEEVKANPDVNDVVVEIEGEIAATDQTDGGATIEDADRISWPPGSLSDTWRQITTHLDGS